MPWARIEPLPPYPPLPIPNAYDDYQAAFASLVDLGRVTDAVVSPYMASRRQLHEPVSLTQKADLLHKNEKALARLKQGLSHEFLAPPPLPVTIQVQAAVEYPTYSRFRSLVRLFQLEGDVKSERGDWSGAVQSYLDAVQFGESIVRGSPVLMMMVGNECISVGRRGVWKTVRHLNSEEARAASLRLEKIIHQRVPFAETLIEEKRRVLAGASPEKPNEAEMRAITNATSYEDSPTGEATSYIKDDWMTRFLNRGYLVYLDQLIRIVQKPYAARPPAPEDDPHFVISIMSSAQYASWFKYTDHMSQNLLLVTTLALRSYHAEQGNYPETLAALVPATLSRVPEDPFAREGRLRYRRTDDGYLLYSVGPDGKDDGGKPIRNPLEKGEKDTPGNRHVVRLESKGDIVAGVNVY